MIGIHLKLLNKILFIVHLRWSIQIVPYRQLSNLGIRIPTKSVYMYNYLSIGVDAQVALDFHKARDSRFYVFSNRIFNKVTKL